MPNRILRDWTDSETMDKLSVHTERFFTRLIMKVDDYGRFSANTQLLKSNLYPLKTDVRITDIALWLAECKQCGLVTTYNVANKEYLQIENFKQVLRQKREKYPSPDMCVSDATQVSSTRLADASLKRNESETETKENDFLVFVSFLNEKVGKKYKGDTKSEKQFGARLKDGYTLENFQLAIENAVNDPFHKETGFKHLTAEFFTRQDKLEKFLNATIKPVSKGFDPYGNQPVN